MAIGLFAAPALAEEPAPWWKSPEASPAPRVDPLRNMGIALTVMGAAGLVGSSVMIATTNQDVLPSGCPPTFGCPPFIQNSGQQVHGAGLLGASLFGVLLGAPLWAIGSLEEPMEAGPRSSDGRFLAGVGLTVFGAASSAAGAFAGLADTHGDYAALSVPFAVFGTASMLVGLPLWASGAKRITPAEGPKLTRRSRPMMAGGITLTILGAATAGAGAIMTSFGSSDSGFRGFLGAMTFTSLGLVMTGIPMWYFGQEKIPESPWVTSSTAPAPMAYVVPPLNGELPKPSRAAPPRPRSRPSATSRPEIQIGPTSVAMRFSF